VTESRTSLPGSYEDLMGQARAAHNAGDIDSAIAIHRRLVDRLSRLSDRVLARRPELHDLHRQARLQLTNLLVRRGRHAEAIEVEEVLLHTHPENAVLWRTDLAILRIAKGEIEAGLAELEALAQEHPDDPVSWLVLASEARTAGQLARSQTALDRAQQIDAQGNREPNGDIQYERFLLYKALGQLDDALAAWEEAVASDSDKAKTVRRVYTMLTEAGRYSEALSYVERDKNRLQAGYQRALIAHLSGEPEEARRQWQMVAALDPDEYEYGHDAWVEAVLRLGDPDPALAWLQESLSQVGTARLVFLAGVGWAMHDDVELAEKLFQRAIDLSRQRRLLLQKLDGADWRLLDSLVADDEIKAPLKSYFAVVETLRR